MIAKISRRDLLRAGCLTTGALGLSAFSGPMIALADTKFRGEARTEETDVPPKSPDPPVELFYRDDWLGAPWVKPDPVMFIHGNDESGITWYGWVPRMGQVFRLLRPDLPGFGQSAIPPGFQWSLSSLATILAHFLDSVGVESAHIVGAKTGGAIAMQFAADYPKYTRTLTIASGPITPVVAQMSVSEATLTSQAKRLGSGASREQIEFWNKMMTATQPETRLGIAKVMSAINMETVLPRIIAPTLVITVDQSGLQSVEKVLHYQQKIPNSRLLVLPSDAYHVAVMKADECVTNVLSFIRETQQQAKHTG
jgi:3-oxoadipate enol-lactonase